MQVSLDNVRFVDLPDFSKIENKQLKYEELTKWLTESAPFLVDRIKPFNPILAKIENDNVRKWARICLAAAPRYFWDIPASLSGKYHPEHTKGKGGLVQHTLEVAINTWEMGGTFGVDQNTITMDRCIAAAILHDTVKYGPLYFEWDFEQTEEERDKERRKLDSLYKAHDIYPEVYYKEITKVCVGANTLTWDDHNNVMRLIKHHMGSQVKGEWGSHGVVAQQGDEQLVHMADYVASRKALGRDVLYHDGEMSKSGKEIEADKAAELERKRQEGLQEAPQQ